MRRLGALAVLTILGLASAGNADVASATVTVTVRPAAQLNLLGASQVQIKIRLNRGAEGRLWTADSCTAPPPEAQTISRSGVYTLPLEGAGSRVCLTSTDGTLSSSLALPTN